MNNSVVKLVPNFRVKELLEQANKSKHTIEVEDDLFRVRDRKSCNVIFKGIKIRSNLWGLTFDSAQIY